MRLHLTDPTSTTARHIVGLKKSGLNLKRVLEYYPVGKPKGLIVLCNGTPDDKVTAILALHLDGNIVVGLSKPEANQLGSIDYIKTYTRFDIPKYLFLIDQEERMLSGKNNIFAQIKKHIRDSGITPVNESMLHDRCKLYECTIPSRRPFQIIAVVNGMDEVRSLKHCIEDHLTHAAGVNVSKYSKVTWRRIGNQSRRNVFTELIENHNLVKDCFPQHVCGLSRMEDC